MAIIEAANAQLGFAHPALPDWRHISFCLFAGPLERGPEGLSARSAVAIRPGKIDRSPTGTGVSARMALLHARGAMKAGERFTATSIIGSTFAGRIVEETLIGATPAIVPEIGGRGWITGVHQHMLDPDDPWPEGYRLSDTKTGRCRAVGPRNNGPGARTFPFYTEPLQPFFAHGSRPPAGASARAPQGRRAAGSSGRGLSRIRQGRFRSFAAAAFPERPPEESEAPVATVSPGRASAAIRKPSARQRRHSP